MTVNRDILAGIMADFEVGADLRENPFDLVETGDLDLLKTVEPFLVGGAVPDTANIIVQTAMPDDTADDHALAFATAGFLQGLAIGYEYATRVNGDDVNGDDDAP